MNKLNLDSIIENTRNKNTMYNYFTEQTTKKAIKQAIKEALPEILLYVSERADADIALNDKAIDAFKDHDLIQEDIEVYVINSSILELEKEILIKLLEE